MRDPRRISICIEKLRSLWHLVPDWRFGQLISNFFGYVFEQTHVDIFYIEDDQMLDLIDGFCKSIIK